jgi:hypothetical protein
VQKASTPTTLSAISSTSHARGQAVAPGDAVTLTWKFVGVGTATCTHDGLPVSNAPGGLCRSPLTVTAKAFSSGRAPHAVNVTFADVCGRSRTAAFTYTQAGVAAVTPTEILDAGARGRRRRRGLERCVGFQGDGAWLARVRARGEWAPLVATCCTGSPLHAAPAAARPWHLPLPTLSHPTPKPAPPPTKTATSWS